MKYRIFTLLMLMGMINLSLRAQELDPLTALRQKHQLKTDLNGSYPQHIEESYWQDAWVPYAVTNINYRTDGQPSVIERSDPNGQVRETYTYHSSGMTSEALIQQYAAGTWVNTSKYVYTYRDDNNPFEELGYEWTGTAWEMTEGTRYTYTMDGNRTATMTVSYFHEGADWTEEAKYLYTYSGSSTLPLNVITQQKEDGVWTNFTRANYTFDGQNLTSIAMEFWENGAWSMNSKTDFEEGDYGSTVFHSYMWLGDSWLPTMRMTHTNDSHGNAILSLTEYFTSQWMILGGEQYLLTYNGNDVTQRISQTYVLGTKTGGDNWQNQLKEVFSNFASLSTGNLNQLEPEVTVYPNPATSELNILLEGFSSGSSRIVIMNMLGATVYQTDIQVNGGKNLTLPTDDFQSGVYFIRVLDSQNQMYVTKVLISK